MPAGGGGEKLRPLLEPAGENDRRGVPRVGGGRVQGPARREGVSMPRE